MSAKRVLVTGAAGFMGSHLVDALVASGHQVLGVDDLSGGYQENVARECEFARRDLRDRDEVERYVSSAKPEVVFHLAADATEGRSQFTPIQCIQRNLVAYMNLLTSLIRTGFDKMVLASSMSVYGAQQPPFSEELPRRPEDIYGICKGSMEAATEIMSEVYGFRYTIVRPHNVYGVRQNLADPYRNVVAIFINCVLRDKNFYIYGDGQQKRAFTYVDDCTPYLLKTGFEGFTDRQIFNIGPDREYTINHLAEVVLGAFSYNGNLPAHLRPQYLPQRPKEVQEAYCTCDKAKRLLGFQSTISLEEGVSRMVEWARKKGPQAPRYLDQLELVSPDLPVTWAQKLI